jgi:hypothetical protein
LLDIVSNAVVALSQGNGEALTRSQAHQALHIQPNPEAEPEATSQKSSAPMRLIRLPLALRRECPAQVSVVAQLLVLLDGICCEPSSVVSALARWR